MFVSAFNIVIHDPLYNALVFLISVVPYADVGIAVILLTVLVKLILFPFAKQAIETQFTVRKITPELEKIKKEYKDDQQEQVKRTLALYKENDIHPLSGFLVILIQLPIILGLYWIFFKGGLPQIDVSSLYTFMKAPMEVNMQFLSIVDMGGKSIVLALLAGATQFIHARIAIVIPEVTTKPGESLKDDLMRSMHIQMKYVLPVIVGVIAYTISAAVALYWTTSNVFTIVQELLVRRSILGKQEYEK